MSQCIKPTPPAPDAPPEAWAAYHVAFAEYLECLDGQEGVVTIESIAPAIAEFKQAALAFRNSVS